MKYLKTYEKIKHEYEENDYVLVDIPILKFKSSYRNTKWSDDNKYWDNKTPFVQIFKIMDRGFLNYRVIFYNNDIYDIDVQDILRHLTSDEIDNYESMKTSIKQIPQKGDYVAIKIDRSYVNEDDGYVDRLESKIGQISKKYPNDNNNTTDYYDIEIYKENDILFLTAKEIVFFSNNYEDVEIYLQTRKYNL